MAGNPTYDGMMASFPETERTPPAIQLAFRVYDETNDLLAIGFANFPGEKL